VWFRLPETLKPENRRPFTPGSVVEGFGIVFGNRISLACIIATALLFGALMAFLNSSQQIYVGIFGVGVMFPAYFAAGAACSALGGFINSRLVMKHGMRRIAFSALTIFTSLSLLLLVLSYTGWLTLPSFFIICSALFMSFSLTMPNLGSMAMEPLGEVAGTAASAQGAMQMVIGATIGTLIGQAFDGTVVPLGAGFCGLSAAALCIVLFTSRKPLQQPAFK
jgi:DHA1 family bicyclomycin/chloramphenicol resistance-like MFS transporter